MKKHLMSSLWIVIFFILFCFDVSASLISGRINLAETPQKITLNQYDFKQGVFIKLDEVLITADQTFEFKVNHSTEVLYQLEIEGYDVIFPLSENLSIEILIEQDQTHIQGAPKANSIIAFQNLIEDANQRYFGDLMAIQSEKFSDANFVKEKMTLYKKRLSSFYKELENAIDQMGNSVAALYCLYYLDINKSLTFIQKKVKELSQSLEDTELTQNWQKTLRETEKTAPGEKAPWINVKDMNGNLLELPESKYILIDFWAGWCKPCLIEIPLYQQIYKQYHEKGLEIIGVNMDFEEAACHKITERMQIPWIVTFDGERKIADLYLVKQLPQNILIDPDGKIIAKNISTWELEAILKEKL